MIKPTTPLADQIDRDRLVKTFVDLVASSTTAERFDHGVGITDAGTPPTRSVTPPMRCSALSRRGPSSDVVFVGIHLRDLDGDIYRFHDANGRGRNSRGSNNWCDRSEDSARSSTVRPSSPATARFKG